MRILHIWDQAGVACILAKYQRRLGHEVKILKRSGYDPFDIFQFYNEPLLDLGGNQFLKLAIKEAKNYDVVHVHTIFKILPELRKKYHDKKLVLHYHGSEVRRNTNIVDSLRLEAEDKSDIILVATPDLTNYISNRNVKYIPNPVDTEHFTQSPKIVADRYFTIKTHQTNVEWMLNYLTENGFNLKVDVIDRVLNPIPYSEIPNLIRQYSHYIDIKYIDGVLLDSRSKIAFESLACGLRVLRHDLQFTEKLPEDNKPENVINKVIDVYTN